MGQYKKLFLVVTLLLSSFRLQAESLLPEIKVMSFNVRYPSNDDGLDQWTYRRPCVVHLLQHESPDIIAFQEAYKIQIDALAKELPSHAWIGRSRYGNQSNEYTAIFFRSTRFEVVDHGDFWLSDTPHLAGSISWGHPLPRMVTWLRLREKATQRVIGIMNTHFPWRSVDADARVRGAQMIKTFIQGWPADLPVVVTGDFNTTPDSLPHTILSAVTSDAREVVNKPLGAEGTWHAFKGLPQTRIDWILSRGLLTVAAATLETTCDSGRYPSDHFPVTAVFRWLSP